MDDEIIESNSCAIPWPQKNSTHKLYIVGEVITARISIQGSTSQDSAILETQDSAILETQDSAILETHSERKYKK